VENMRLAYRIRAFRKLKGYTQQQLAEKTGLSLVLIGSIERGNRKATPQIVDKIALALGISSQELNPEDELKE